MTARTGCAGSSASAEPPSHRRARVAALALAAGLDARLGSFAAAYVLVLAIIGPLAVSTSERLSRLLPERLLPERSRHEVTAQLDLNVGTSSLYQLGTELLQIRVVPGSRLQGLYATELRLPAGTTLGLLVRDGHTSSLEPTTRLRPGDTLLVFTLPNKRLAAERRLRAQPKLMNPRRPGSPSSAPTSCSSVNPSDS